MASCRPTPRRRSPPLASFPASPAPATTTGDILNGTENPYSYDPFGFSLTAGYRFLPFLSAGVFFDYANFQTNDGTDTGDYADSTSQLQRQVWQLGVYGRYYLTTLSRRFHPWAEIGVGPTEDTASYTRILGSSAATTNYYLSYWGIATALKVGLDWRLSPFFSVGPVLGYSRTFGLSGNVQVCPQSSSESGNCDSDVAGTGKNTSSSPVTTSGYGMFFGLFRHLPQADAGPLPALASPIPARGALSSPADSLPALARRHPARGRGRRSGGRRAFPGITRLGGQIVAALYLAEGARSMDELSAELGRSKSNIFANLRGLEAAGIVEHHRLPGARHDRYRLRGKYPDVVIGAYIGRLRRVVSDKRALVRRSREILGEAGGPDADALRAKLEALGGTYDRFAMLFEMLPAMDGPLDLEAIINGLPRVALDSLVAVVRKALRFRSRRQSRRRKALRWPTHPCRQFAVISTRRSFRPMKR